MKEHTKSNIMKNIRTNNKTTTSYLIPSPDLFKSFSHLPPLKLFELSGLLPLILCFLVIPTVWLQSAHAQTNSQKAGISSTETVMVEADSNVVTQNFSWDNSLSWNAEIDKTTLPQNDTLTFTATIEIIGNPMEYKFDEMVQPKISNLDLAASSSSNKTIVENGENHFYKVFTYKYIPKTPGMAYINPARLNIHHLPSNSHRELTTSRLSVEVSDPVLPKDYTGLFITLAVILVVISIALVIFWFVKKRSQKVDEEIVEEIPLETQMKERILELKEYIVRNDYDSFYDKLHMLINEYITKKFNIPAKGLSTAEVIAELEISGLGGRDLSEISNSLSICDKVRYAREKTDDNQAQNVLSGFERLLTGFEPNKKEQ